MKKRLLIASLAAASALAVAAPAEASTTINYTFGGLGSGTMALDYDGSAYSLVSLDLMLGGQTFTESNSILEPSSQPFYCLGTSLAVQSGCFTPVSQIDFSVVFDPGVSSDYYATWDTPNPGEGTLTITRLAAVPEPATWATILLGFGAIGFAMRRRKAALAA